MASTILLSIGSSTETRTVEHGSHPTANSAKSRCQARSADFQRKLKSPFALNDSLLRSREQNSGSTLLSLPDEIILAIFTSFDDVVAQVALALTCKRLALIARDVNLTFSSTSKKYAGFLPPSVFDIPGFMKSLRPWMPSSLLLCNHCLTYRPHGMFEAVPDPRCKGPNHWTQVASWEFGNGSWQKQLNNICPMCNATCTFSDYVDCHGCRVLGRLGNGDCSI